MNAMKRKSVGTININYKMNEQMNEWTDDIEVKLGERLIELINECERKMNKLFIEGQIDFNWRWLMFIECIYNWCEWNKEKWMKSMHRVNLGDWRINTYLWLLHSKVTESICDRSRSWWRTRSSALCSPFDTGSQSHPGSSCKIGLPSSWSDQSI